MKGFRPGRPRWVACAVSCVDRSPSGQAAAARRAGCQSGVSGLLRTVNPTRRRMVRGAAIAARLLHDCSATTAPIGWALPQVTEARSGGPRAGFNNSTAAPQPMQNGRGERIRTSGLYVPNVALYQAKLHPECVLRSVAQNGSIRTICRLTEGTILAEPPAQPSRATASDRPEPWPPRPARRRVSGSAHRYGEPPR